ncbi:MAG: hypothetical protein HFH39_11205 [Lachnospiraceae bacterium]|nr:hypothetical protein [Lachnospiraceae bacterium]
MAGTDMTTRILEMYDMLRKGKEIKKAAFCWEHGISERTFERDLKKVRMFLSEGYSGREVCYSQARDSYQMPGGGGHGELSLLEIAVITEILEGEQVLEKGEFEGFLRSLQSVAGERERGAVQRIAQCAAGQYQAKGGQGAFLKLLGDLLKCIESQEAIWLRLKGGSSQGRVRLFPVDVKYQSPGFYLLGYLVGGGLTAFALNRIESFQVALGKQGSSLAQGYDSQEGRELLKKIQREKERGT